MKKIFLLQEIPQNLFSLKSSRKSVRKKVPEIIYFDHKVPEKIYFDYKVPEKIYFDF